MRRAARVLMAGLTMAGLIVGYGSTPASALSFTGSYFTIAKAVTGTSVVRRRVRTPDQPRLRQVHLLRLRSWLRRSRATGRAADGGRGLLGGSVWCADSGRRSGAALDSKRSHGHHRGRVQPDTFFDGAGGSTSFLNAFSDNFFVGGPGGNNNTLYRAVHWQGLFTAPAGATFTVSADDHAFLYVNGASLWMPVESRR